ncbi:hypothetical protein FHS52_001688 [Erythromicrobium ramosum]|uniref:DUF1778 domain-containing protein n=1 Tax=Erythrobacter ramosus TaxID=35811 RepID=A0ABR6HYP2_9SPHN|nr:hypothetical protein [Erythrobacter ramosus]
MATVARLTLSEALAGDRLSEFVEQAEAEGIGPADRAQFEGLLGRVTAPQPEDQTSRLPAHGSKRGK